MGLDLVLSRIDYEGTRARWSYGGFADFRTRLAAEIGIDLDAMQGFGGEQQWPDAELEPLVYLLNHSDCDGELGYTEAEALAPRLRQVVSEWDSSNPVIAYDRDNALRLCEMLDEVVKGDACRVEFT